MGATQRVAEAHDGKEFLRRDTPAEFDDIVEEEEEDEEDKDEEEREEEEEEEEREEPVMLKGLTASLSLSKNKVPDSGGRPKVGSLE